MLPLSLVLVLPLVGDLIGAVESVSVSIIHDSGIEATDHLGDDPLDVVHDGVGVGVGGDVLVVLGLPEGDHVLPDGSLHGVLAESLGLVLQGAAGRAHCDLHTLITKLGPATIAQVMCYSHVITIPGSLVKLDVVSPKLLDEVLLAGDVEGRGGGDKESKSYKRLHGYLTGQK